MIRRLEQQSIGGTQMPLASQPASLAALSRALKTTIRAAPTPIISASIHLPGRRNRIHLSRSAIFSSTQGQEPVAVRPFVRPLSCEGRCRSTKQSAQPKIDLRQFAQILDLVDQLSLSLTPAIFPSLGSFFLCFFRWSKIDFIHSRYSSSLLAAACESDPSSD